MKTSQLTKHPPIWLLIIFFFTLYFSISIGITSFLSLPEKISLPNFWGIIIGLFLLIIGFTALFFALKTLKIRRAFGKEMYKPKFESKLITSGIYSYTRNPIYLSAFTLFAGWFLVLQFTFLLIVSFIFLIHFYFVAKWEEKELTKRFGEDYLRYKEKVPLFISFFHK